jgi:hypothetical protein
LVQHRFGILCWNFSPVAILKVVVNLVATAVGSGKTRDFASFKLVVVLVAGSTMVVSSAIEANGINQGNFGVILEYSNQVEFLYLDLGDFGRSFEHFEAFSCF